MSPSPTTLTDEIGISLANLADAATGAFTPTLRLGVTGLSRAGKTIFITALVQADRLGLPIANVLRKKSIQMRLGRRQLAEEKAQKVPVKILFPLMFCIFPALFIVIIGPGAIRIVDTFSHGGL